MNPVMQGKNMLTACPTLRALPRVQARRPSLRISCKAGKQDDSQKEQKQLQELVSVPMAAAVAAALIVSATVPEDALAARSGGRVGGSAFRSAPRSAPRAMPRGGGGSRVYNNYYGGPTMAPPMVGGYGYGGYSMMPSFFFFPGFGFGGFFQLMITLTIISFVFNTIKSITDKNRRDDDYDDFY